MTKPNRFEKFTYSPEDNNSEVKDLETNIVNNHTTEKSIELNIQTNKTLEKKVPANFTLYPAQKKKLKELGNLFSKSGSELVGEVIDQLYDAYIDK